VEKETIVTVETIRTLAHVALMAAAEGNVDAADRILVALERTRPKEPTIRICRAMLLTRQERYPECLALLKDLASEHPKNQTVKSILGFVLFTTGEQGWQTLLEEVINDGSDAASVELAQTILAEHKKEAGHSAAAVNTSAAATASARQFIRYA